MIHEELKSNPQMQAAMHIRPLHSRAEQERLHREQCSEAAVERFMAQYDAERLETGIVHADDVEHYRQAFIRTASKPEVIRLKVTRGEMQGELERSGESLYDARKKVDRQEVMEGFARDLVHDGVPEAIAVEAVDVGWRQMRSHGRQRDEEHVNTAILDFAMAVVATVDAAVVAGELAWAEDEDE